MPCRASSPSTALCPFRRAVPAREARRARAGTTNTMAMANSSFPVRKIEKNQQNHRAPEKNMHSHKSEKRETELGEEACCRAEELRRVEAAPLARSCARIRGGGGRRACGSDGRGPPCPCARIRGGEAGGRDLGRGRETVTEMETETGTGSGRGGVTTRDGRMGRGRRPSNLWSR